MRAGDTYTLTARYSGGASVNADWQAFLQLGDGLGIAPATVYGARGVEVTLGQTGSLSLSYTAQAGDTGKSLFVTAYAVASGPGQARRGGFDDLVLTTTSAPALPEPASWALMVTGFALVGARRRRAPAAA
ncbi:MAG: PEPxxWA-CTERM sorting domain-containing protein [Sphingomonadaceae bacterium]|nr:PEPxxWA-CTERM sorting domain-containing protein [Sphingomonadaceae bacterium]